MFDISRCRRTAREVTRAKWARRGATYHHGDLRRALLDASLALIATQGPEGFTLRAAARAAGVSDAAPYHHFADREALLACIATEGFDLLIARLHDATSRASGDALDRARALGVAYVTFAAQHPSHFRVMVRGNARRGADPEVSQRGRDAFELVKDALLDAARADGAQLPVEQLVFGAWGVVHGLAFLTIDGHLGAIADDAERLGALVDGVLSSVTARVTSADRQR